MSRAKGFCCWKGCDAPEFKATGYCRRHQAPRWTVWRWLKARLRLSKKDVCEMSRGRGAHDDFHDYFDTEHKQPFHFVELECERCGKKFAC